MTGPGGREAWEGREAQEGRDPREGREGRDPRGGRVIHCKRLPSGRPRAGFGDP